LIKSLTGGDLISARGLYQGLITFKPEFTIFLQTNHKPAIRNWDQAIEARLWLVPFDKYIEQEDRDYHILEKLVAEGPGIFNWMIEGLKRYQEKGHLIRPMRVKQATEEYKQEQDRLSEFLSTYCIRGVGEICYRKPLYSRYYADCYENGVEPIGQNLFAKILQSHHGIRDGGRDFSGGRKWIGISLKPTDDTHDTNSKNLKREEDEDQFAKYVPHVTCGSEEDKDRVEIPRNGDGSHVTHVTHVTNSHKSVHEENIRKVLKTSDISDISDMPLNSWLSNHQASGLPDPGKYRLVDKPGVAKCRCKDCTSPPLMSANGAFHLCQKHFNEYRDLWKMEHPEEQP